MTTDVLKPTLDSEKAHKPATGSGKGKSDPDEAPTIPDLAERADVGIILVDENLLTEDGLGAAYVQVRDQQAAVITTAVLSHRPIFLTALGAEVGAPGAEPVAEPVDYTVADPSFTVGALDTAIPIGSPIYRKSGVSAPYVANCALRGGLDAAHLQAVIIMGQSTNACVSGTVIQALRWGLVVHTSQELVRGGFAAPEGDAIHLAAWRAGWIFENNAHGVAGLDFDHHVHIH